MNDLIYLDYAAATPLDESVVEAMKPYFTDKFYNPSAIYLQSKHVKKAVDDARSTVAQTIGARPSEILFTAGGTEANNLAIKGLVEPNDDLLISAIEHDSVLVPALANGAETLKVDKKGAVNLDDLTAKINDNTKLVSVMVANNEIGTVQPIKEISSLIDQIRRDRRQRGIKQPIYLHSDACQAANYLDLHVSRLGVDLMTINGGKIYGPKQSGILFVKAGIELRPLVEGGGQENGLRSGTENVPAIIGFAEALTKAQQSRIDESKRLAEIQTHAFKRIEEDLPEAVINGDHKHRLVNNIHLTLPGQDNERLIFALDELGIMVAAGSACSASDDTPSHVLRAIGLSDEVAQSSLRITLGRGTTQDNVDRLIDSLKDLIAD